MFTGINVNETKKITLKCDPDKDNPTYFTVGVLDGSVVSYINDATAAYTADEIQGEPRLKIDVARRLRLYVKFGLRGIENFKDPVSGSLVAFETETVHIEGKPYPVVKREILDILPQDAIKELAGIILGNTHLSEEEEKN